MADTCSDCRFLLTEFDPKFRCGELPPLMGGPQASAGMGWFPGVELTEWCGKWAPFVATGVVVSAGDNQTAPVTQPVALPVSVLVTDDSGRPVFGATVTFAVASGGGIVTGAVQLTNRLGIATVGSWTMGPTAGANSITATTGVLPPVVIDATAEALIATLNGGSGQTATVGTQVAIAPSVLVTDGALNPIAGVAVVFTASGTGTVQDPNAVTDAFGIAAPTSWTLAVSAGSNLLTGTLAADAAGNPVQVLATGEAAIITLNGGDAQTVPAGSVLPVAPSVLVTDQALNPLEGVGVFFIVQTGGGAVAGGSTVTDINGIAAPTSWTLGAAPGPNTLDASSLVSATGSPVLFTATGT